MLRAESDPYYVKGKKNILLSLFCQYPLTGQYIKIITTVSIMKYLPCRFSAYPLSFYLEQVTFYVCHPK